MPSNEDMRESAQEGREERRKARLRRLPLDEYRKKAAAPAQPVPPFSKQGICDYTQHPHYFGWHTGLRCSNWMPIDAAPSPVLTQPSADLPDEKILPRHVPWEMHKQLQTERPVLPVPPEVKNLILHAKQLLEWVPTCSKGSSGFVRQENLRKSIEEIEAMNANS